MSEMRERGALALFVILLVFGDLARNSLGGGQEIFFGGWGLDPIYINPWLRDCALEGKNQICGLLLNGRCHAKVPSSPFA